MTFTKKIAVLIVLTSLTAAASAREVTGKIIDMISWHDGHTIVRLETTTINGCGGKYFYSLGIKGQDTKAEPMLSVALGAYLANRTVKISTVDGSCQGGEEKVVSIQLKP